MTSGDSCLLLGFGDRERRIHVVCAPREGYLAIITAYLPDAHEWSKDFRKRVEKCIHCQGEMKRGTTPFHVDRKGCHLTPDAVSAWVCGQWGEAYFEEKEVDAIQDLVEAIEQKKEALAVTA